MDSTKYLCKEIGAQSKLAYQLKTSYETHSLYNKLGGMESTKPTNSDSSTEFIFLNKHSFHNKMLLNLGSWMKFFHVLL